MTVLYAPCSLDSGPSEEELPGDSAPARFQRRRCASKFTMLLPRAWYVQVCFVVQIAHCCGCGMFYSAATGVFAETVHLNDSGTNVFHCNGFQLQSRPDIGAKRPPAAAKGVINKRRFLSGWMISIPTNTHQRNFCFGRRAANYCGFFVGRLWEDYSEVRLI